MSILPHPAYLYGFSAEMIAHAAHHNCSFPVNLRMAEEMPALRGITVSDKTVRWWGLKIATDSE